MQKIFISYSRKDIDIARKLAGDLEGIGYDVWWDITDLRGGDDWVKTLPAAIEAAQHFILILTPNSANSKWVQKEYTQALNLQKKIIPLMFEMCGVPFALNDINYVDFIAGEYAVNFKNLLNALGYKGKPPVVAPFERATTMLRPATRKYAIPAITGVVIALLILAATFIFSPKSVTPLPTQSLVSVTETKTESITLTPSVNVTDTPLPIATETPTPITPSLTPSATKQPFETLTYCVNSLYAFTINVRSGPGTNHAVLGEPLPLRRCLAFRGVNEDDSWLLIAQDQEDPRNTQYEGGWIFRELLGLGLVGPIDLPFVTLTATPTDSPMPTITLSPTLTPTETPSPTEAPTSTLEPTATP